MKKILTVLFLIFIIACPSEQQPENSVSGTIAVVGGTVIDLSDSGNSDSDIEDAVVLIKDGLISAVGTKDDIPIPDGAKIIDAEGNYILPGLIDGFAALNNQSYADAYLYMGVTSIISVAGGRRGFPHARPARRGCSQSPQPGDGNNRRTGLHEL